MVHGVNLGEGFRRLTAVASVLLFLAGSATTVMLYANARQVWLEAHSQPTSGRQLVLAPGRTHSVPDDTTGPEILDIIEGKEGWRPYLNDAGQEITDYRVEDVKAGDQVGYLYAPKGWWAVAATAGNSVLYDRRTILEAESASSLPGAVASAVRNLRAIAALPTPPASPRSVLGFWAGATVLASSCPWFLFTLVSWVVRGFSAPKSGAA